MNDLDKLRYNYLTKIKIVDDMLYFIDANYHENCIYTKKEIDYIIKRLVFGHTSSFIAQHCNSIISDFEPIHKNILSKVFNSAFITQKHIRDIIDCINEEDIENSLIIDLLLARLQLNHNKQMLFLCDELEDIKNGLVLKYGNNRSIEQFDKICKGSFTIINDYINKYEYIPTENAFCNLCRNDLLSWLTVINVSKLFQEKGFKFTVGCLSVMYRVGGESENFNVLINTIVSELLETSINTLFDFFAKEKIIPNILHTVITFKTDKKNLSLTTFHNCLSSFSNVCGLYYYHILLCDSSDIDKNDDDQGYDRILTNMVNFLAVSPTLMTLKMACSKNFGGLVGKLCELGIQPNIECLYNAFIGCFNYSVVVQLYNYKIFVDKKCFHLLLSNSSLTNDILNVLCPILVAYGLLMDYDCLKYVLERGFVLDSLELYGLEYNEKLFDICRELRTYPSEYITKIGYDQKQVALQEMFLSDSKTKIIDYINEYGLKIDKYCYINALKKKKKHLLKLIESITDIKKFAL